MCASKWLRFSSIQLLWGKCTLLWSAGGAASDGLNKWSERLTLWLVANWTLLKLWLRGGHWQAVSLWRILTSCGTTYWTGSSLKQPDSALLRTHKRNLSLILSPSTAHYISLAENDHYYYLLFISKILCKLISNVRLMSHHRIFKRLSFTGFFSELTDTLFTVPTPTSVLHVLYKSIGFGFQQLWVGEFQPDKRVSGH